MMLAGSSSSRCQLDVLGRAVAPAASAARVGELSGGGSADFLPFVADGEGSPAGGQTQCAMVFVDDQHLGSPVRSYCPVGGGGRPCAQWLGGDVRCDQESETCSFWTNNRH
jgi:hypothetical protein